jgi:hypothetical protein
VFVNGKMLTDQREAAGLRRVVEAVLANGPAAH